MAARGLSRQYDRSAACGHWNSTFLGERLFNLRLVENPLEPRQFANLSRLPRFFFWLIAGQRLATNSR